MMQYAVISFYFNQKLREQTSSMQFFENFFNAR